MATAARVMPARTSTVDGGVNFVFVGARITPRGDVSPDSQPAATGRPSNGTTSLATLYDVSADLTVNSHVSLGTYYARAEGQSVIEAIYPLGKNAHFRYVELMVKF
jgi:hypothetical protein